MTTTFTNRSQKPQTVGLEDNLRVDGGKEDLQRSPNGTADRFWLHDRFWGQGYGLDAEGYKLQLTSDARVTGIKYEAADGTSKMTLAPGQSFKLKRRLYPGADLVDVNAIAANLKPSNSSTVQMAVKNKRNAGIARATVEFKQGDKSYGSVRTDGDGAFTAILPNDKFTADIFVCGRQIAKDLPVNLTARLAVLTVDYDPGTVAAAITDANGKPIPCKVEFTSLDDQAKLNFGPETAEFGVGNLAYSANGKFHQIIPPGKYTVTISHGPEFDMVKTDITVPAGETIPLTAKLIRSVDTTGWISSDFHSHSSPSGDNTSSQLGRVLNLVAEQIEFAPCTEHNRISTYQPHIDKLGIAALMATVSGMELTSEPLPLNHENAFP